MDVDDSVTMQTTGREKAMGGKMRMRRDGVACAPKRDENRCWGDVLGKVKGVRSTSRLGQVSYCDKVLSSLSCRSYYLAMAQ